MYSDPSINVIHLAMYGGNMTSMKSIQTIKFSICAGNYVPHQIGLNSGVSRNTHPFMTAEGIFGGGGFVVFSALG